MEKKYFSKLDDLRKKYLEYFSLSLMSGIIGGLVVRYGDDMIYIFTEYLKKVKNMENPFSEKK